MRFLLFPAFVLALSSSIARAAEDDEEPWCVLNRFNMRTSKGHAIQFVTKEDGTVEATLCADMENFFIIADPVEPTFSSGKKCKVGGVPRNPMDVGMGGEVQVEIYTYEADPKSPSEKTPITVKRLDLGLDQSECEVRRTRSAAEDCGYAPYLEEQRQVAALSPAMKMPEAPTSDVAVAGLLEQKKGMPPQRRPLTPKRYLGKGWFNRHHKEPKKQRKSAKWAHLKAKHGISGLDGC